MSATLEAYTMMT